jgi:hypothetical protein
MNALVEEDNIRTYLPIGEEYPMTALENGANPNV